MAVYIFGQAKEYARAGLDYGLAYRHWMPKETECPTRFVCTDLPGWDDIERYRKAGIDADRILGVHQYLADDHSLCPSIKAEDKLEELKKCFQGAGVVERESEIWLVKDGYVIVLIQLDERDKSLLKGVSYYSQAKLLRKEIYTDRVSYVNYYMTAEAEHGLYAKLTRRAFYNRDGAAAYDQIFEGETEWYVFPDGRRYTKPQLIGRFVEGLNLSEQDLVVLDASVPREVMRAVFTFGRKARIAAVVHAGNYFAKDEAGQDSFSEEYPYYWFPYSGLLDMMIVSTGEQKEELIRLLKEYHCDVPKMRIIPVEGEFTYTILNESQGEEFDLSWEFAGKPDGFWIYDETGKLICETRNIHEHHVLIRGYGKESGFVIKAFVDTVKGKMAAAKSGIVYWRKS